MFYMRKIRIKDIAEKANVSIGTVDRVLHKRGEVAEETKNKVLSILKELNYEPNVLASLLSSQKKWKVACIIPAHKSKEYWNMPVKGMEKAYSEVQSYGMELVFFYFNLHNEKTFVDKTKLVLKSNFDAVILSPYFFKESIDFIKVLNHREIPYIFIDSNIPEANCMAFFCQNAFDSGLLAANLINIQKADAQQVLIVNIANNNVNSKHFYDRTEGFMSYFRNKDDKNALPVQIVQVNESNQEFVDKELIHYFRSEKKIRGIFVSNSRSFYVANFLEKNKIQDVVLIGYDLIQSNIEQLEKGNIQYLISQQPFQQGYSAIMTLYRSLIFNKKVQCENFSQIDIITKQNFKYYKELETIKNDSVFIAV